MILKNNPEARLQLIGHNDDEYAEDKQETGNHLMEVHLPGFQGTQTDRENECCDQKKDKDNWYFTAKVVQIKKVQWAIGFLCSFKLPGRMTSMVTTEFRDM